MSTPRGPRRAPRRPRAPRPCALGNNPDRGRIAVRAAFETRGDGDRASPLFAAGNVGVVSRNGRLHRDEDGRSEAYGAVLAKAGSAEVIGTEAGAY